MELLESKPLPPCQELGDVDAGWRWCEQSSAFLQLRSSSEKQIFVHLRVTLGMVAWVRICRLAQQSLVLCDTKEQSIPTGWPV